MAEFAGKVVLITGATGGIGAALVDHFAGAGATLVLADRESGPLRDRAAALAARGVRAATAAADLRDAPAFRAAIAAAVAETGPVDILVSNAGVALDGTLARTTPESWETDLAVNLTGAYHVVSAVIGPMIERRRGAIVTVGSVNGLTTLGHPAYSAAKAGLISYTKALAVEYGPYGIRANMVCPGTVRTPIWQERVARKPEIFESLRKWYPLGRVAEPSDIAKAVAFLASDEQAGFITGTVLVVDGGLTAGNRVMASELTLDRF